MALKALSEAEISNGLAKLSSWKREGHEIVRQFKAKSFADSIRFVTLVAEKAEAADHHPDILVQYDKVTLRLSTHDANGLTEKDFSLAAQADKLFAGL